MYGESTFLQLWDMRAGEYCRPHEWPPAMTSGGSAAVHTVQPPLTLSTTLFARSYTVH